MNLTLNLSLRLLVLSPACSRKSPISQKRSSYPLTQSHTAPPTPTPCPRGRKPRHSAAEPPHSAPPPSSESTEGSTTTEVSSSEDTPPLLIPLHRINLAFGVEDLGSGLRVQGTWFRAQGSGFRVQGVGFGVQGSGFMPQGFRVQGLSLGFRI